MTQPSDDLIRDMDSKFQRRNAVEIKPLRWGYNVVGTIIWVDRVTESEAGKLTATVAVSHISTAVTAADSFLRGGHFGDEQPTGVPRDAIEVSIEPMAVAPDSAV